MPRLRLITIAVSIFILSCQYVPLQKEFTEDWREPDSGENIVIGRALVKKKATDCSSYYVKKSNIDFVYLVACSRNNIEWRYYKVFVEGERAEDISNVQLAPPVVRN